MRSHSSNELIYMATLLASDATTVVTTCRAGVSDLSGRRLEAAQLIASETSHLIVLRFGDAMALTASGFISCDGVLYIVDYLQDTRTPRPKMWLEVYCHVERSGN
jgi:hypothetical protein